MATSVPAGGATIIPIEQLPAGKLLPMHRLPMGSEFLVLRRSLPLHNGTVQGSAQGVVENVSRFLEIAPRQTRRL